jgi:hypothetical protein
MLLSELKNTVHSVRTLVAEADPSAVDGAEAASMVSLFCDLERLAGAGKLLFARRVEATRAFAASGHRNSAEWLGSLAGERASKAKCRLETARRMARIPELENAVVHGEISGDQAEVIASAVALDPHATAGLLAAAHGESFRVLDEKATKVRQAALSEQGQAEQRARVHRNRYIRACRRDTGGVAGSFFVTEDAWGRVMSYLEPEAEASFAAARASGDHESREAYLADALVTLCTRGGSGGDSSNSSTPPATVHVHVDAAALRRGRTEGDECCEVAGVGAVPVATARSLLGDAFVELLVRDGSDVLTITGKGRTIPVRLRSAVRARDRHCRWPGCRGTLGLQIHHWDFDYRRGGATHISNLVMLCKFHHDRCTYHGWRVEADPAGTGEFFGVEPDEAVSEEFGDRKRRLATLRAKARRSRKATRPMTISETASDPGRQPARC